MNLSSENVIHYKNHDNNKYVEKGQLKAIMWLIFS